PDPSLEELRLQRDDHQRDEAKSAREGVAPHHPWPLLLSTPPGCSRSHQRDGGAYCFAQLRQSRFALCQFVRGGFSGQEEVHTFVDRDSLFFSAPHPAPP